MSYRTRMMSMQSGRVAAQCCERCGETRPVLESGVCAQCRDTEMAALGPAGRGDAGESWWHTVLTMILVVVFVFI